MKNEIHRQCITMNFHINIYVLYEVHECSFSASMLQFFKASVSIWLFCLLKGCEDFLMFAKHAYFLLSLWDFMYFVTVQGQVKFKRTYTWKLHDNWKEEAKVDREMMLHGLRWWHWGISSTEMNQKTRNWDLWVDIGISMPFNKAHNEHDDTDVKCRLKEIFF